jgi:hypothetical protein
MPHALDEDGDSVKKKQESVEQFLARDAEIFALSKKIGTLERQLRQERAKESKLIDAVVAQLVDEPPRLVAPPRPPVSKKQREEIAVLHISDTQLGKVTETYDTARAAARVQLTVSKAIEIADIRRSSAKIDEIHLYLGGDMIEGEDIFATQAHEIDSSVYDQACINGPAIFARAILALLQAFPRVKVCTVPGNHGRNGSPHTRAHPRTNWDQVLYRVTRTLLLGTPEHPRRELGDRLQFEVSERFWVVDRVYDWGNLIVHGHQISGGFAGFPWYGCVPDDHKIMTKRGWKALDELVEGEPVLAYDTETGASEWQPTEKISVFDVDDDIYRMERPGGHSIAFTRDHKWPAYKGGFNGPTKLTPACEMNSSDWLPVHGALRDGGDSSILDPRLAAILGWVVTDGTARWIGNHWEAGVYRSPKKYLAEIEELLGREARPARKDGSDDVQFVPLLIEDSKAISAVYREKADLPALVGMLSRQAAEAMFEAMMRAEGSKRGNSERFCQVPGPVADAFQMLSVLVGRTAWASIDGEGFARLTPRIGRGIRPSWGQGLKLERFRGRVWCPTTRAGTWWVRSPSGMVMPTGNTAKKAWGWIDSIPEQWDNLLFGHFHTPVRMTLNKRQIFANGTTESDNVYAQEQLSACGRPCQRLMFMDRKVGVISDDLIYLD